MYMYMYIYNEALGMSKIPKFKHLLIAFGGLGGLEEAVAEDQSCDLIVILEPGVLQTLWSRPYCRPLRGSICIYESGGIEKFPVTQWGGPTLSNRVAWDLNS